ncbi:MAG: selenium cofactor biosynthesis protein YqeC [Mobilitalea sp.]
MRLMLPNKIVWENEASLIKAFQLADLTAPIISVVGAGGKTSTIERLAQEYEMLGKKVMVTTTTKMFRPLHWYWYGGESMKAVDKHLENNTVLWIGLPFGEDKIMSPKISFLKQLMQKNMPLLIEADGAKRLPFKVPNDIEPVIIEGTQYVVAILGMDALGRQLKEVCFRYDLAAIFLHKEEDELITIEDYIEVITSNRALRKGVTEEMKYLVILNKVEGQEKEEQAKLIRNLLKQKGIEQVFLTSYGAI